MATRRNPTQPNNRLQQVREEFWPDDDAWTGVSGLDDGWFKAPRTLPLIFSLMRDKTLSGKADPTGVYLELLSRQFGDGVVEIQNLQDHAYAAGYTSDRGPRTWIEHMRLLETLGFIKIQKVANNEFKYVLIIHPATAIHALETQNKVPDAWKAAYRDRRIVTKELSYEDRQARRQRPRVQSISQGESQQLTA